MKKMSFWQDMMELRDSSYLAEKKVRAAKSCKGLLLSLMRTILIAGVSYIILAPMIGMIATSFFSNADYYSPMVYVIPIEGNFTRYRAAMTYMKYWECMPRTVLYSVSLTLIQLAICSLTGYGFARHDFPLKSLLFGCVVVMIIMPVHTIMLPLYPGSQHNQAVSQCGHCTDYHSHSRDLPAAAKTVCGGCGKKRYCWLT